MHDFTSFFHSSGIFWFCALTGSGMFLIQFLMNLLFGSVDEDIDLDSADAKTFRWISLQTLTGFLMMFGWAALSCQESFKLNIYATLLIALLMGFAAAVVLRLIYNLAEKLISPGTVFNLDDAIGQEGYVYAQIPLGESGKVCVTLKDFTHEIEAICLKPLALPAFTRIKVVAKSSDNIVIVEPIPL